MKLIDEKGRLFGKINIIDLVFLILLVVLLCGVSYNLFFKKSNGVSEQPKVKEDVAVEFLIRGLVPEVENGIKIGEKIIVNNQLTDAEVIDVAVNNSKILITDSAGQTSLQETPLQIDIKLTVKMKVDVSDAGYFYNDEKMKVNGDFEIETKEFYSNSKIIAINCLE